MTRVKENTMVIEYSTKIMEACPNDMQMEGLKLAVLADISKSLAVIADAMTEKQEEKKNE